jgi:hypothetical protein
MADRPQPRRQAEDGVDQVEAVLGLDVQARARGWRQAKLAGKQADLFTILTNDLVERVLDEAASRPDEWP